MTAIVGRTFVCSGEPRRISEVARTLFRPDVEPDVTWGFRRGDIHHRTADVSRASGLLSKRFGGTAVR